MLKYLEDRHAIAIWVDERAFGDVSFRDAYILTRDQKDIPLRGTLGAILEEAGLSCVEDEASRMVTSSTGALGMQAARGPRGWAA
jgi:hypothetical protein